MQKAIEASINKYEGALPPDGWPNWVLGNHDKSRIATRVGKEQARSCRYAAAYPAWTPTMYYGDEIGMEDVEIPKDRIQDPQDKNIPEKEGQGSGKDTNAMGRFH
jgi:alpha-glucosidase